MNLTSVSFVIPMYNEEHGIGDTIAKITSIAREISNDYEIIIADDASSDQSAERVGEIAKTHPNVRLVRLEKNTKFGGALKAGLKHAEKEIVIYTDSDLPIDRTDIKEALLLLDKFDIVTANSKIKKGENMKRIIMSKVYNFLIEFFFKTKIKDINSGFKIYKRKVLIGMELISKSPFVDVEIFVRAMRKNFTIGQYPIIFKNRGEGKSYISRPSVVLATMRDILKFKFGG